jgi:hypothetical protein
VVALQIGASTGCFPLLLPVAPPSLNVTQPLLLLLLLQ